MAQFPEIAPEKLEALLTPPTGPVDAVLDTDTYNEIDDQFALVYALLSPKIRLKAVYAAPFYNSRSSGPEDGMERSYDEILRVMGHLGLGDQDAVFKGSRSYLPADKTPVVSPAAEDLVAKALEPRDGPLYVLTIGCITNVASAILMEPSIIDKIVIVWLGGHPWYWDTAYEFNLKQDVPAAQVVFDSGVPVVQIPCKNVAEHLRTTVPEMAAHVKGQGAIGDYLYEIFCEYTDDPYCWSKVVWDISSVAWINNAEWVPTALRPSPILLDDVTWAPEDASRHVIAQAKDCKRDQIFRDLFSKITEHVNG